MIMKSVVPFGGALAIFESHTDVSRGVMWGIVLL